MELTVHIFAGEAGNQASAPALEHRLLKPLPDLGSAELAELGAAISRDIYQTSPGVHWADIAGLGTAKVCSYVLALCLQFVGTVLCSRISTRKYSPCQLKSQACSCMCPTEPATRAHASSTKRTQLTAIKVSLNHACSLGSQISCLAKHCSAGTVRASCCCHLIPVDGTGPLTVCRSCYWKQW